MKEWIQVEPKTKPFPFFSHFNLDRHRALRQHGYYRKPIDVIIIKYKYDNFFSSFFIVIFTDCWGGGGGWQFQLAVIVWGSHSNRAN